jgi:hypothetical protein
MCYIVDTFLKQNKLFCMKINSTIYKENKLTLKTHECNVSSNFIGVFFKELLFSFESLAMKFPLRHIHS